MSSTDERRFEVLRAIVTDYVATQEPIGSKALVDRHHLGVSSATARHFATPLSAFGPTHFATQRALCHGTIASAPASVARSTASSDRSDLGRACTTVTRGRGADLPT